jgi:hypothetical protein
VIISSDFAAAQPLSPMNYLSSTRKLCNSAQMKRRDRTSYFIHLKQNYSVLILRRYSVTQSRINWHFELSPPSRDGRRIFSSPSFSSQHSSQVCGIVSVWLIGHEFFSRLSESRKYRSCVCVHAIDAHLYISLSLSIDISRSRLQCVSRRKIPMRRLIVCEEKLALRPRRRD